MKPSKIEKDLRDPVVIRAVKIRTVHTAGVGEPDFRAALETIDDAGLDELCADKELSTARRNCAKAERKRREKAAPTEAKPATWESLDGDIRYADMDSAAFNAALEALEPAALRRLQLDKNLEPKRRDACLREERRKQHIEIIHKTKPGKPVFTEALKSLNTPTLVQLTKSELPPETGEHIERELKVRMGITPGAATRVGRLAPGAVQRASGTSGDLPAVFLPTAPVIDGQVEIVPAADGEPGAVARQDEDWGAARLYISMARAHAATSAAFMVLTGVEIKRLRKKFKPHAGQPKKNSRNVAGILSWPELLKSELGISDDTARRYESMAEAASKRVKELNATELLNKPLSSLPDERRERIVAAVQKVTDGQTAQQLMFDWGISKAMQGQGKPLGGKRVPGLNRPAKATAREVAEGLWMPMMHNLEVEGLERRSWAHLPQAQLARLRGILIDLGKLVRGPLPLDAAAPSLPALPAAPDTQLPPLFPPLQS